MRWRLGLKGAAALSFEERLGLLVDTEWAACERRRRERRIRTAKLRSPATLWIMWMVHAEFDVFLFLREWSKTRQVGTSRRRDARRFGQPRQERRIVLPVSRRTMLRNAAFASRAVASLPNVLLRSKPASAIYCSIQVKTA